MYNVNHTRRSSAVTTMTETEATTGEVSEDLIKGEKYESLKQLKIAESRLTQEELNEIRND